MASEQLDQETAQSAVEAAARAAGPLRESIVDVLGSLVPGTTFLLAAVPSFLVPMAAVVLGLFPDWRPHLVPPAQWLEASIGSFVFVLVPLLLLGLAVAYVSGHLFFRQDPKVADEVSFAVTRRYEDGEGMFCRAPAEPGSERGAAPAARPDDGPRGWVQRAVARAGQLARVAFAFRPRHPPYGRVEFPYRDLREYLTRRGLDYLAAYVPWDRNSDETARKRTKHRVNALKIRIHLECEPLAALLAKTEAHVRMSSSMWYVARVVIQLSSASLVAYLGIAGYRWWADDLGGLPVGPVIVLPLLAFFAAHLVRIAIERTLHYQREREVLYILESAHWLRQSGRVPKLFDGLVS